MIARIWHGRTRADRADEYLDFLKERALPDYRATPGNRAALVLRRLDGDRAHFLTLTHWDSPEAIRGFAGERRSHGSLKEGGAAAVPPPLLGGWRREGVFVHLFLRTTRQKV